MIINNKDAAARLNSSNNLMNRLASLSNKKQNGMNLFIPPSSPKVDININKENKKQQDNEDVECSFNIFGKKDKLIPSRIEHPSITSSAEQHPKIENLIPNSDEQVKLNLAHDAALDVLNSAVGMMREKLDDIRADKLPSVITAASKVVESIRRDRNEAAKSGKDREVHYHFYTPQQKQISDYEVIDVA